MLFQRDGTEHPCICLGVVRFKPNLSHLPFISIFSQQVVHEIILDLHSKTVFLAVSLCNDVRGDVKLLFYMQALGVKDNYSQMSE